MDGIFGLISVTARFASYRSVTNTMEGEIWDDLLVSNSKHKQRSALITTGHLRRLFEYIVLNGADDEEYRSGGLCVYFWISRLKIC